MKRGDANNEYLLAHVANDALLFRTTTVMAAAASGTKSFLQGVMLLATQFHLQLEIAEVGL